MDNWNPGERNVRWGARSARTERGRCAGPSEAAAPPRGKCRQGHLRPGHLRPACVVAEPRRTLGVPHRVTSPRDGAPTRPCGPRGRHHWLWYGGTETGAPGAAWAWSPLRAVNALGGRKPRCGRRRLGASPSAGPERCGRRSGPLLVSQNEARWRHQGSWALWRRRLGRGRAAPPSQSPFCGHEQTPLTGGRGLGALAVLGPGRPSSSRGRQVCGVGAHGCHGDAAAEKCGRG